MQSKIDYLEYPAKDLDATKAFFTTVFNWQFVDYGPEYTAFSNAGIDGGFYRSDNICRAEDGSALTVFHSDDLIGMEDSIIKAGGTISTPAFEFPGGKRFHFLEPSGNEFAVWTKLEER